MVVAENLINLFFTKFDSPEKCKKLLFFLLGHFWKTGEIILFIAQNEVNDFLKFGSLKSEEN